MENNQIFEQINTQKQIQIIGPLFNHESKHSLSNFFDPLRPTVFIDGGALFRNRIHKDCPCWIIGDNDNSYNFKDSEFDILLPKQKDISDLGYLFSKLQSFCTPLHLLGFLGERKDHELFVFGELTNYLNSHTGQIFLSDQFLFSSKGSYRLNFTGTFSFGSFESAKASILGQVVYQLEKQNIFPLSSNGLSNRAKGNFQIESDKTFWIYSSDPYFTPSTILNNE